MEVKGLLVSDGEIRRLKSCSDREPINLSLPDDNVNGRQGWTDSSSDANATNDRAEAEPPIPIYWIQKKRLHDSVEKIFPASFLIFSFCAISQGSAEDEHEFHQGRKLKSFHEKKQDRISTNEILVINCSSPVCGASDLETVK